MQIKYINNDINMGIDYDWRFIMKEYRKLKCPDNVYDPTKLPLSKAAYFKLLSERKTGKTTNILLVGMIMNKFYGTTIQYIRQTEDMIMNKVIQDLFKTIREFDYIPKLTDGKYDDCIYKARRWYYVKYDETGEILEQCPEHFMFCLSVDKNEIYKSSYNAPKGDWIIYDEYISSRYRLNEFVGFMDLIATIKRDRMSVRIIMLANTIDLHSEYFNEFEVYDQVQLLEVGQREILTTDLGTKIYIELISDRKDKSLKSALNTMYFGFKNPKLNSIRGGAWATNDFPHIQAGFKEVQRGLYIEYHDKLLALDIVEYDDIGLCINVHKASKTYDDSIIYSLNEPKDKRYRYYLGQGDNLDRFIVRMVHSHKIRFQNNACGTMFFNHFNQKDARKAGY